MALARSASGPGGLSINTGSANLFGSGSTAQQPAASGGGLFGANNTQASQPAATSSAGGGLFGSNTAAASPKPAGGGLFGAAPAATATSQPQQTGSLFGGGSNTTTTNTGGGGLFGASTTAASQPQQPAGGGLFGGANNNAASTTQQPQQTGGGLFGNANAQNQTQQPAQSGTSLFGAKPATPAANSAGGLFGGGASTAQKPAGSLFGGQPQASQQPAQQSGLSLGGSLGFGALGQSTNQQTVPGVRIDLSNLKGTTRFNDLTEQLQKEVEEVDKFIQNQINHHNELESFMPAHGAMLEAVPNDVKFVARKYDGVRNALESDAQAIESARGLVRQDADHARLSFRAIDNLKLPEQYHTNTFWASRSQSAATANTETDGQDLIGFFSKTADEVDSQLGKYQENLSEIEMHMHGVHDGLVGDLQRMLAKNGSANGADDRLQELVLVLREFEQGILTVASEVGSAREGMTRLQLGEFIPES